MIYFDNVSKAYRGGRPALQSINFHIYPGEMMLLTGHSGAGKSTLLKLICGIERLSTGHIWFDGYNISRLKYKELPFLRRQIGMIFQDHNLLFNKTVYYNIAMPLIIKGKTSKEIRNRVFAILDKVNLLDKVNNYPIQLSSGEQQRVGIARAMVNNPKILLADEPTGNLDDKLSNNIMTLFNEFNKIGITIIIATHNLKLMTDHNYSTITLLQGKILGSK